MMLLITFQKRVFEIRLCQTGRGVDRREEMEKSISETPKMYDSRFKCDKIATEWGWKFV